MFAVAMNLPGLLLFLSYAIATQSGDSNNNPSSNDNKGQKYLDQIKNYSMQDDMLYRKVGNIGSIVISCVGVVLGILTIFSVDSLKDVHLALANGFCLQSTMFMFFYPFTNPFNPIFATLTIGIGAILTFIPQTRLHISAIASMGTASLFLLIILDISKGMFIYVVMLMYLIAFEVIIWTGFFRWILLNVVFSTSSTYFVCCLLSASGLDLLGKALFKVEFGISLFRALAKAGVLAILIFFAIAPIVFSIAFSTGKKSTPTA